MLYEKYICRKIRSLDPLIFHRGRHRPDAMTARYPMPIR